MTTKNRNTDSSNRTLFQVKDATLYSSEKAVMITSNFDRGSAVISAAYQKDGAIKGFTSSSSERAADALRQMNGSLRGGVFGGAKPRS